MLEAAVEDIVFEQGTYQVGGTDRAIPLIAVAKSLYRPVHLPDEVGLGLEGSGTYGADIPSYPNGCHVVEVEIDPATGQAAIDRYTVVDDCGVPINPMICEGQIQGGLAQGIGQALLEHVIYDRESGQLVTGSYMDYAMPRADDMGTLTTRIHLRAVQDQSGRRQGRRRIRRHRCATGGDECRHRRAAAARHRPCRHAGAPADLGRYHGAELRS